MRFRLYVFNKNENNKKIILSSDEIKECNIKFLPKIPNSDVHTIQRKEIHIIGRILGEINNDLFKKMDIATNINNFKELWKEKNSDLCIKTSNLLTTKYPGEKLVSIDNILEGNKENIYGLREWCLSFQENDYRDILIERIGKNNSPDLFYLENIFIHLMEENGSTSEGNGEFKIILKQKINIENNDKFEY